MIYAIVKINKETGDRENTNLAYALKRNEKGILIEDGDAAVAFAKSMEEAFDDGFEYHVTLVG